MQQNPPKFMTPFDELTTPSALQNIKLFFPFFPDHFQRIFAFYIKFAELQYTLQFFSHFNNHTYHKKISSPFDIIDELKPYMSTQDCETLELILSIYNMMNMMQETNYDFDPAPPDNMSDVMNLMNMFPFSSYNNNDSAKGNTDNAE